MQRSPDDLCDFSYSQSPSPSTATLMAPYGTLTPAPVSRTRDGKPRVMDLNNLGLMNTSQQDQHKYSPYQHISPNKSTDQGSHEKAGYPMDSPDNADPTWNLSEEKRMDNTLNRAHQTYMREVHGVTTPTDDLYGPSLARPLNPVPIQSPLGWEQDKARRARRAADRIRHEYVNELRMISRPSVRASTPGEVQLYQMRARMQTRQPLGAETIPASSNFMNPIIYMPPTSSIRNTSLNHSSIPNLTATSSASPPVTFYPTSPLPNAPTWTEDTSRKVKQTIIDEARQKEIELDEKRRQLLTKKKGKHGKSKKKKKDKHGVVHNYTEPEKEVHFDQLLGQQQSQYMVQLPTQQSLQCVSQQPIAAKNMDQQTLQQAVYPHQQPVRPSAQYLGQQPDQQSSTYLGQQSVQQSASYLGQQQIQQITENFGQQPVQQSTYLGPQPVQQTATYFGPQPDKQTATCLGQQPVQQVTHYLGQQPVQQPKQILGQQPVQQSVTYMGHQENQQPLQQLGPQNAASGMQYLPHRPSAPPKKEGEDGESFNKRRRRIIAKVAGSEGKEVCIVIKDIIPKMKPCLEDVTNQTYIENADTVTNGRPMIAPTEKEKIERFICNPNMHHGHTVTNIDTSKASDHPALIPRQTSQQAIGWNSDAAKRGLGFKSKLKREVVQENKIKKTENKAGLTPQIRNKWKKATFY